MSRRKEAYIIVAVVVVLGVLALASLSAEGSRQRLEKAAACNGTLTADQIEEAARRSAAETGRSIAESEQTAEAFACPAMAGD